MSAPHERTDSPPSPTAAWPAHGWVGFVLVAVFWALNWTLPGTRTHWVFFPLWLGYCLVVDALVVRRKGHSPITRSPRGWATWFLISIPGWWLFEAINERTANWIYVGGESFSDLEYTLFASLSFSTVIPAVFGTAELVGTWGPVAGMRAGRRLAPTGRVLALSFLIGWAMLTSLLLWPTWFFPFVWTSVWLILEPVNVRLGNRSLLDHTAVGDWRPVVSLALGALICGFFWELWNYWSFPKWTYHVPFVDFLRVFEMPLLGYGGYLPFGLELFAIHALVAGAFDLDSAGRPRLVEGAPGGAGRR